jgi:ankyrin repeat protein
MLACYNGDTAAAHLLIAHGADVEAKDKVRRCDFGWREGLVNLFAPNM